MNLRERRRSVPAFVLLAVALITSSAGARQDAARTVRLTPEARAALARVTADSLRGHLSFIASDALEGRDTPSRGLDVAAEYIAAQFRRAGLRPAGDDNYFQAAEWLAVERSLENFRLELKSAGGTVAVDPRAVSLSFDVGGRSLWGLDRALTLAGAGVVKVDYKDAAAPTAGEVGGRVVLTEIPDFRREERARQQELYRAQSAFLTRMGAQQAALVISIDRGGANASGAGSRRLVNPGAGAAPAGGATTAPFITVHDPRAVELYDSLQPGASGATVTLAAAAPAEQRVRLRNVAGLLPGSDPKLKDTYVLVTAHYDHVGVRAGEGDTVYNGANDNGSGTAAVIELASALSALRPRPRRSILFMTFFGEEKGLLGSRHYGRHPLVPVERTVAQINLEQVGRTDDSEGPRVSAASLTGYDYTDVGAVLSAAGAAMGVAVTKHPRNSDAYFGRSDNQALADLGVPAHTLSVAFNFPDYHGVGDHWEKIDYVNMERVVRATGAGVLAIANDPREPRWNEANPRTARYVKAWRERRAGARTP